MKRLLCALAALAMLLAPAACAEYDFSDLTLTELYDLRDRINGLISARELSEGRQAFDSGSYKVGRDIPAGDYVLLEDEDAMFASVIVRADDSEDSELVIHHLINKQCVMRLTEGTWLTLSEARAYPLEQAAMFDGTEAGEGGYLVGTLLPAGRYLVDQLDKAPLSSYSVYDGILGTGAQLMKFEVLHEAVEIDLIEGEYLELSGCWLRPASL